MEKLTVLVTGSSRGIGRAVALDLVNAGYTVVIHGRKASAALEKTLAEIQVVDRDCRALVFDVADREQAGRVLAEDIETFGTYYGVVCNAGISADGTFAAMPPEDWDRVIQTDLGSFYNVVQPLVMPMVRRRKPGRIIAMSSVSGVMGNRGQVNYSAAKAGLIGAVKALALELALRAITVNAIAPGLIQTDMVDEEIMERAMPFIPMKRAGTAEEVAGAVTFLMSPKAGYITRQVIEISGGLS
ncbi:MAG: 3-oxoacyl-ACP reductase FabG [Sutterellaceae bacterium]|nr:3-oxoacyl-ACP reductase FabG [Sutterellaceae bacterium]